LLGALTFGLGDGRNTALLFPRGDLEGETAWFHARQIIQVLLPEHQIVLKPNANVQLQGL
jgi:hypothetical protein